MNELHEKEYVPVMRMSHVCDVLLRNPVNLTKQAAKIVMLNENAWLLVDVAGMPLWGLA
jgi:hypothetical protein